MKVCADSAVSSPVFSQTELSGQKLKDLGAVLLVLVGSVGHTDSRHGQHHTRRARAGYQHRQPGLHHHIHPLKDNLMLARVMQFNMDQHDREGGASRNAL